MNISQRIIAHLESSLCSLGLLRQANWDEALQSDRVYLYAGDLPRPYRQHSSFYGITPYRRARRNIFHDLSSKFPIGDNCVDIFQAEDVFEHIDLDLVPEIIGEVRRVLKPHGWFRFSVPDYNCPVIRDRSLKGPDGRLIFDPGGGGALEDGNVVGGGHVWFPDISIVKSLFKGAGFSRLEFQQYYREDGSFICNEVDHSLAFVRRSAEFDPRSGGKPISIILDAYK